MTNLDIILKSRDLTLLTKVHIVKAMIFPGVMYGCESWTIKKAEYQRLDAFDLWCWRRQTLESLLDSTEMNLVNPKENQPEYSCRTEDEALVLWPPDVKRGLLGKDPDAGKDRRRLEEGIREHEMVAWHHQLSGLEFEQTLGDDE